MLVVVSLTLYAVALWVAIFFVFRTGIRDWKANSAARMHTVPARVLDKRETYSTGVSDTAGSAYDRWLLFEFSGRQKELKVTDEAYHSLKVGQTGQLTLRGADFLSFEPDAHRQTNEDDLYKRLVRG